MILYLHHRRICYYINLACLFIQEIIVRWKTSQEILLEKVIGEFVRNWNLLRSEISKLYWFIVNTWKNIPAVFLLHISKKTQRHLPAFSCMTGSQWPPFCGIVTPNVTSNATDEKLDTFWQWWRRSGLVKSLKQRTWPLT